MAAVRGDIAWMWTNEHRARQAAFERRRYPTDLTDAEWGRVEPLLPEPAKRGRKPGLDLREILDAIRYLARASCGWRMLPHDFPPWQTVYWWFGRLVRRLLFRTIHDVVLMLDRKRCGRAASPSAGVLDSQTVKAPATPQGGGYDAAKKLKGRKRHIAVDPEGRLLLVNLTPADIQDAQGAERVIVAIRKRWPLRGCRAAPIPTGPDRRHCRRWLKLLFADGAYDRSRLMSRAAYHDFVIEVVRKLVGQQGFRPLPRRWVVERIFGWMMRWRRLVRDHEHRCDVSEAMIHVGMDSLLLRRVTHPCPFSTGTQLRQLLTRLGHSRIVVAPPLVPKKREVPS